eukprot:774163-Amphidinium_carterae.2
MPRMRALHLQLCRGPKLSDSSSETLPSTFTKAKCHTLRTTLVNEAVVHGQFALQSILTQCAADKFLGSVDTLAT